MVYIIATEFHDQCITNGEVTLQRGSHIVDSVLISLLTIHGTISRLLVIFQLESGTIMGVIAVERHKQDVIRMESQSCGCPHIAPFQSQYFFFFIGIFTWKGELLFALFHGIVTIVEMGIARKLIGKAVVEFSIDIHKRIPEYFF